mgnify:CR=1 FL=1
MTAPWYETAYDRPVTKQKRKAQARLARDLEQKKTNLSQALPIYWANTRHGAINAHLSRSPLTGYEN